MLFRSHSTWLQFGVPLATVLAGLFLLKSKRDDAVFACPTVLMFTVYIFCVKMHERYLFPVLLCLLFTYAFTKEKRFLLLFAGTSTVHFLNVAYVLYLNNAYISPTSIQILFLSALHVLLYIYMLYIMYRCFISEKALRPLPAFKTQKAASAEQHTNPAAAPEFSLITDKNHNVRLTRVDLLCIAVVTLLYGIVAFTNLGDHETANTTWTPQNGESAVFEKIGRASCRERV